MVSFIHSYIYCTNIQCVRLGTIDLVGVGEVSSACSSQPRWRQTGRQEITGLGGVGGGQGGCRHTWSHPSRPAGPQRILVLERLSGSQLGKQRGGERAPGRGNSLSKGQEGAREREAERCPGLSEGGFGEQDSAQAPPLSGPQVPHSDENPREALSHSLSLIVSQILGSVSIPCLQIKQRLREGRGAGMGTLVF